ncbi:hypothetical protein Tco_0785773 [Tanacetum coccineum]
MVAYLKKPTRSEGFQEIVYFLNGSHIRYALTKNPTIYVSLIEKFWQTATVRTVDGKELIITEASIRRHLQLADVDADEAVYKEWDDRVERDTTTAASLDAEQASEAIGGSIAHTRSERVPTLPCDLPLPRVHTLGSDEGSMTLQELMVLCTTLSKKVESLEADLKQTKKVYGASYTKLIKKVKKLEKIVKSNQKSKDCAKVHADASKENVHTYTRRRRAVSTGSGGISTAEESVSTAGASMPVNTADMVQEVNINIPSPVVVKDKGKGKIEESEDEQIKRTKLQQEQDRLGHEAAVRLQELDEEERQRMARVHEAA